MELILRRTQYTTHTFKRPPPTPAEPVNNPKPSNTSRCWTRTAPLKHSRYTILRDRKCRSWNATTPPTANTLSQRGFPKNTGPFYHIPPTIHNVQSNQRKSKIQTCMHTFVKYPKRKFPRAKVSPEASNFFASPSKCITPAVQ